MKFHFHSLLICGVLINLVGASFSYSSQGADFSVRLYKSIARNQNNKNMLVSPYAIRNALGIAGFGARGRTQRQLGKLPEPWTSKKDPSYKLLMANRLWVHLGYPISESYMNASEIHNGGRPWLIDFAKSPDFAKDRINGWVSEKTNGKMRNMVSEESLPSTMRMLLTSAIYFKGEWVFPFSASDNQEMKFRTESHGKVKVPFMHKKGSFNFLQAQNIQILELPYQDGEIALDLFLPESEDGLLAFEQNLRTEHLDRWFSELTLREVNLYLPKFDLESDLELKESLMAMGIADPFVLDTADFSGMNGNKELFLGNLYQRTQISMSEDGTEANSMSASQPSRSIASGPATSSASALPSQVFKADHPFMFLIRHRATNSILFMGHVAIPAQMNLN